MSDRSGLLRRRVLAALACPHCGASLGPDGASLLCPRGHRFDLARQGYANLLPSGAGTGTADTADMVAARTRVLAAGHLEPVTNALVAAAVTAARGGSRADGSSDAGPEGLVVDLGAGTGHHLAAVLDALPGWDGLAVDLSKHAARRAARAHPRMGAVVADAWRRLPLVDAAARLVIAVFAPRGIAEVARILAPDGAFVLVTPAPDHLKELVEELGLISVDPRKRERLARDAAGVLALEHRRAVRTAATLPRDDVEALVRMGPSAHHLDVEQLRARLARRPGPRALTVAVEVAVYRHAPAGAGGLGIMPG